MSAHRRQTRPARDAPRRVRNGLKLRREAVGTTKMGRRWLDLALAGAAEEVLADGLEYARAGQVVSLEVAPGAVRAAIQGRATRPYRTVLAVPALAGGQWDGLIDAMASEAAIVARLLTDELPDELEALFASRGLPLLPDGPGALTADCTCRSAAPCKHAVAVAHLVAERLDAEPLEVLTLRGMSAARLRERLRQARAMRTHGVAAAHADPLIPESQVEPPALESCLDDFWRVGPTLGTLHREPPPAYVPHALLRRLGPSPLMGRFPLVGLLASIYDSVAQSAVRLRDRAEHIDEG